MTGQTLWAGLVGRFGRPPDSRRPAGRPLQKASCRNYLVPLHAGHRTFGRQQQMFACSARPADRPSMGAGGSGEDDDRQRDRRTTAAASTSCRPSTWLADSCFLVGGAGRKRASVYGFCCASRPHESGAAASPIWPRGNKFSPHPSDVGRRRRPPGGLRAIFASLPWLTRFSRCSRAPGAARQLKAGKRARST